MREGNPEEQREAIDALIEREVERDGQITHVVLREWTRGLLDEQAPEGANMNRGSCVSRRAGRNSELIIQYAFVIDIQCNTPRHFVPANRIRRKMSQMNWSQNYWTAGHRDLAPSAPEAKG